MGGPQKKSASENRGQLGGDLALQAEMSPAQPQPPASSCSLSPQPGDHLGLWNQRKQGWGPLSQPPAPPCSSAVQSSTQDQLISPPGLHYGFIGFKKCCFSRLLPPTSPWTRSRSWGHPRAD